MQRRTSLYALFASIVFCTYAAGQTQPFGTPKPQIIQRVDESATVTLAGNVHPLARAASSSAPADLGTSMAHMVLNLKGSAAQEAALDQLIAAQNNPKSPLYRQYLTPQSFGSQFGAAPSDIAKITAWLESHGMHVERVPAGNRALIFSGTAAQVNDAFQTEIRRYKLAGASHYANATDPKIPAALAGAVGGVVKLHDFRHTSNISMSKALRAADPTSPHYTTGSTHYITPADYSIIYDINPLYTAGINGAGEAIAVIARSDIYLSDVQTFRSTFGLKANNPQFVVTNSDPGVLSGDSVETTLDTEWSGAVAPGAAIKVIISSSGTSDGIDLSSLYAVNNNVAPIITLSYGSCEVGMGASELSFYNSLWKQAASQGQSVMVSSGDSGAAGCDNPGASSVAQYGKNINGLCSSPYATCVGGTEFADASDPGQYWLPANSATYGSALSYIPEGVWNESGNVSGGSGIWAGGGGASAAYSKPSWQTAPGVPADSRRDVPDVSLTAASHDGYFIALYGTYYSVGGTSAAAPSFAGMVALVDQKMNARQGLLNPMLYPLAVKQASGGAAVFHDITVGNNSVPGVAGFSAAAGYDLASGLGTIDANLLVNHWTDGTSTAGSFSLAASSTSLSLAAGQSAQTTITSTASASLKAAVTLTVAGAPAGLIATFSSPTIASPGSGTDVLKVVAASTLASGTYNLTVSGTGGGQTATVAVAVVIPAPSFTLSRSATSLSVTAGNSGSVNLSIIAQNGFSSAVALTVSGLPTGVTAAFAPATLSGATASVLKLTAASTAPASTSTLTITGASGSLKATATVSLVVSVPSLSLVSSVASLTAPAASSETLTVSIAQSGLSSPVAFLVTGLPTGVTAAFSPATLSASGSSTLKITAASTVTAGTYPLTLTATGGGLTSKAAVSLVIPSSNFTLTPSAPAIGVTQGNTGQLTVSITRQNSFSSTVALSVSGLPPGVTGVFSSPLISGNSGASPLMLTAPVATSAGSYPLTISATGGGLTKTASVTLVVNPLPACVAASGSGQPYLASRIIEHHANILRFAHGYL